MMKNEIAIGIDVGGSHIVSAAVNLRELRILPGTTSSVKVDNKAKKEIVLETWSTAINKTIAHIPDKKNINIGFAIPGPFDYAGGIALYEGENDKYSNMYGVSIPKELAGYLNGENVNFRFHNDATSFGVGVATQGDAKQYRKIIVVTLGTGFGSAFVKEGIPQVNHAEVPKDGCLWDKPFRQGIGDDYFSTRWCIKRYHELSLQSVKGVKEIAQANNDHSQMVFKEFGTNMAEFMIPFLQRFRPELVVLGGNVSRASEFFLPSLKSGILDAGLDIRFEVSLLMEEAAILGSAQLFDSHFWNQVKNDLPNL
ncbi:ROK family protein [Ulvibacterium sp.]|uniref:ROK family protein n=1 Tax=Ulvibacterium sp. TaxID=2665914 RepID=UPI0026275472|nr:ROK family protein [Ulvibacterium sp.]